MSLVADHIDFAYPGASPVLRGFSCTIEPGERVALVAPSGAGKTTCCRVLAGYLRPDAGRVLVDGDDLGARRGHARAARPVQLIWQHPEQAIDPRMRMRRVLAEGMDGACARRRLPVRIRAAELDRRLARSGLLERFGIRMAWLDRLPHELSGGELMRFCIVRALLAEPRYLICDEMTAMLDATAQARIWHEVIDIAAERAMGLVVVTHSPALLARVATRRIAFPSAR